MKTLQEFQEYFERELRPKVAQAQVARSATRPGFWRIWRWWLLGTIVLMATMLTLQHTGMIRNPFVATIPIPIAWTLTLFVVPIVLGIRRYNWAVKEEGKQKAADLVPIVKFLAPEFRYDQQGHVSEGRVRDSRIFELDGKLRSLEGDDHFIGTIGDTAVEFSEVSVTTSRTVRHKGKTRTERSTDTGLFLVADFNKPFRHATLVMPDLSERLLGAELSGWIGGAVDFMNAVEHTVQDATGQRLPRGRAPTAAELGWQKVRLEDAAFEKLFLVYCTDPVEAHYILTPNIMERLTAFQQRLRFPLTLSFIGTALHAFIPSGALFEGDVDADVTQFSAYQTYYEQLYVVFDLVEAMQLNTRLWAKP